MFWYLHHAAVFSPLLVTFLSFPFIFLPSSITGILSGIPILAGLWWKHQKTWFFGVMFYRGVCAVLKQQPVSHRAAAGMGHSMQVLKEVHKGK